VDTKYHSLIDMYVFMSLSHAFCETLTHEQLQFS
jgi:hypothetical protein